MRRNRHFVDVKILLFLASIVFLFSSVSPAVAQDIPDLFTSGTVTTNFVMERAPDTARVSIDFSLLQPSSSHAIIRAVLPDRTVTLFRTRIEKRGTDNYTWFGKARSDELSSAVFTVVKGIMYGHIDIKGDCYEIGPGQGAYVVTKRNPAEAMPLLDDTLVPKLPASERLFPEAGAAAEDGSQIDVLALYTGQMQAKYGSGLDAKIQSLIDLTNEAYVNSGVSTHLRLAGTTLYSDPHAAEGNATDTVLDYITDDPTAESLRDQYGADLVSLLRVFNSTDSGCGTAWVMTPATSSFESYAYSVVEVGSYGSYYCDDTTLAHELGHNMGCQHDRAHANSSGAYPYSYGYGLDNQFGTIMSYIPPIITYFSTPVLSYDGLPIGVADDAPDSADNVTTINNTRIIVANFRAPVSSGCSFTVSPLSQSFGSSGGAGSIDITAGSGCSWTASTGASWITVNPTNGTGDGTVKFSVGANTFASARTANISVAGETFVVTQNAGCSYSVSPSSLSFPASGGSGKVTVTAGSSCSWSVSPVPDWISISSGAAGSGSGTVTFTVSQNPTTSVRNTVLTIGTNGSVVVSQSEAAQEPAMAVPSGVEVIPPYAAIVSPVENSNLDLAEPVGFGDIAGGGGVLQLQVGIYKFTAPVDVYLLFTASYDPGTYYMVTEGGSDQVFSGELIPWRQDVTSAFNASLFGDIPKSLLPPGTYTVYLGVTPAGDTTLKSYYLWTTSFIVD